MNKDTKDFYQKLRSDIKIWLENGKNSNTKWADFLLLAPDLFHLLTKLTIDPEVPASKKVKIAGIIAYFISPLDFLPEILLGPIGYLDDIAITAYVLNDLINDVDPKIIQRNWAGERDILVLIKTIIANANSMIGSGLWKKLIKTFTR
ncbi:MAG: DUF1232 domain-containing protein [Ignavibacteriaceae bacterium]|nr:DUF1232 domain-containing protein [Ignavibacteriaceae bacterium]